MLASPSALPLQAVVTCTRFSEVTRAFFCITATFTPTDLLPRSVYLWYWWLTKIPFQAQQGFSFVLMDVSNFQVVNCLGRYILCLTFFKGGEKWRSKLDSEWEDREIKKIFSNGWVLPISVGKFIGKKRKNILDCGDTGLGDWDLYAVQKLLVTPSLLFWCAWGYREKHHPNSEQMLS